MANLTSQLLVKLIDGVSAPARAAARSLLGIGKAANGINGVQLRLRDAIERNNAALDRARGRMLDAVAAGYVLKRGLEAPIQAAMNFESAMADVRKVVNFDSAAQFKDFQQQVIELSKRLPMAADGLSQIVAAAGQAGIERDQLMKFAEMAAKVGVAFDITADQAGDSLAKMMTGLGLSIDQTERLADAMNYLSNAQASSAADILDVVRRVGAQSKQFGFNAVQVSAFASAMLSAGAESDVAATSFRNMGRALTKGASATKAQKRAYSRLGLDARKVSKAMQKDAVGTTVKVLEKISQLPKEMQASVSSDLFGDEARALGPLLTNLDLLKKSLGLVAKESDYAGSSTKEYEVRAKTFANNLQLFKNRLTALGIQIGNALIPPLTELMDKLAPLIDRFADFAALHPQLTAGIVGLTGALIALRIAMAGLAFAGLFGRGGLLSVASAFVQVAGGAAEAAKNAVALQRALGAMSGQKLGAFGTFATALRGMIFAVPGVSMIASALAAVGSALAAITAPAWGLIALGVAAVAAAGALLWKYWDRISSVLSGVASALAEELQPAIDAIKPYLTWLAPIADTIAAGWDKAKAALSSFAEWIGSFFSQEVLSEDQKAQWATAGHDAAIRMIEAIKSAFSELVGWAAGLGAQIGNAIASAASAAIGKLRSLLPSFSGPANPGAAAGAQAGALAGHRAGGGPVRRGASYLVGERGPEVVTMGGSGHVRPNSSLGGGMSVSFGDIVIQGVSDTEAVLRRLKSEIESTLRGVQADYGLKMS
ncbi:phage tail tape measure protein [Mesorhizobium sp. M2A.F.Ca.ET.039.01.1.1]|uniref:phage tail tape measure protein n=1 Tax=Mesorhizobium sp. M2A.F.Ca.ET.039.01.1.1 TaxID=2496746 RepID=UPI000FCC8E6F|nr:phage tail tape measure protein [Mesorhizobium sp. M2A.F.Ca.ET.039.01.1.1]RWX72607.1 phage tail tape measure protein [Mesorhizobium sp. M2A.F.Ca.ET.039.01.1.1]